MCVFSKPSVPKPPPAPAAPEAPPPTPAAPTAQDPSVVASRQARASVSRLAAGGRPSTILTSGGALGLITEAPSRAKKTLLGQ